MSNSKSQADYKSQIEPQKPIETTSSPNNANPNVICRTSLSAKVKLLIKLGCYTFTNN
jgi:hypothetical protein